MLGNNKKRDTRRGGLSVIGADVTVTGNIATEGDLHVDGAVEGDIRCGSIVQGASGRIVGSIAARSARIAGIIEGPIDVGALTVQTSARITGDSTYNTVTIETGAQVDGRMTYRSGTADAPLRLVDSTETIA